MLEAGPGHHLYLLDESEKKITMKDLIWNSIPLMTAIDSLIIGGIVLIWWQFQINKALLKQLNAFQSTLFILFGLSLIALFYLADLLIMWFLPNFMPMAQTMVAMKHLHLNLKWIVTLFGVGNILIGLFQFIKTILPKILYHQQVLTENNRLYREKLEADSSNRSKSLFMAHMSHEIRTPMNSVLGRAQLLAETELDAEQRDHVVRLIQAGESLLDLINNILDLSKAENEEATVIKRRFEIRPFLEEILALLHIQADRKGLMLEQRCTPDLPVWVKGDFGRLRHVFLNLIGNAIKFTEQGCILVELSVATQSGTSCVVQSSVSDTGPGIRQEDHDLVFDAFAQADISYTRRFGGTGLGLTLCRRFVDLMGGDLWLESTPGKGSVFTFVVPLQIVPAPILEQSTTDSVPKITPQSTSNQRGKPILLVEDTEENQLVISAFLKSYPNGIEFAADGGEAVERFIRKSAGYSLVLMDIQMPVMDGWTATRAIRSWEKRHQRRPTPIIALTAHALPEEIEKTRHAGCNAHLVKPVKKSQLLAEIDRVLRDFPID